MQQFQDIRKHPHGGHIRAGAGALHHERRADVAVCGEGDNVVAAFGRGERVVQRNFFQPRVRRAALQRADVPKDGAAHFRRGRRVKP